MEYNFTGEKQWKLPIDWLIDISEDYKVLRPILFFHRDQIITKEELAKFFTEKAIITFINDKFIEKLNK